MVKIQWIMDNEKRKATLKRRFPVLVKKAREISVLYDVPMCLVAYPPGESEPLVWPSPEAATNIVRRYRGLPAGLRNELDSADLVRQKIHKLRLELSKVQQETRELEIKNVIVDSIEGRRAGYDDLPVDFLVSVGMKVEEKLKEVKARLQEIRSAKEEGMQKGEPLAMMQPLSPLTMVDPLTSPAAFNDPGDVGALPSTE